jgi:hypothetical protein
MKLQEILEKEANIANDNRGETPQKPTIHRPNINKGINKGHTPKVIRPNVIPKKK